MSFWEPYFDIPAISNSTLGDIDKSIAYWNFKKVNPSEPSVATLLGSGFHAKVLEPEKFKTLTESKFKTVCPSYFIADYEKGSEKLLSGQIEEIEQMYKVLEAHPVGKDILTDAEKEIAIEFDYLNVKCKSKIDWVNPQRKLIRDLKTIDKIENIDKAILNYSYFRQATFYQIACLSRYGAIFDFEFVFVSKDFPDVKVVRMSDNWFKLGIDEIDRIMKKYKAYESGYDTFEGSFKDVVTSYPGEWQIKKIAGFDYDKVS